MLPVVVNANLAQGAIAMGKQDVIVKRLDGVQNLGGITCLCSDKTGTLTIDRVELHSSVSPDGLPSTLPIDLAFLNSSLQTGTRSLLDAAITKERDTACIEAALKFGEVPFDSSRRLLSIYAAQDAEVEDAYIITKGAVEEVLERCTFYINPTSSVDALSPIETLPLNKAALKSFLATADKLNTDGLRLVAVAQRRVPEYRTATYYEFDRTEERDLVFVGFLAFLDPPKEDAADAIRELASLGIPVRRIPIDFVRTVLTRFHPQVKILTGDAPAIAVNVARDIGLLTTSSLADVITGAQLTSLSSGDRAELITAVTRAVIFAKLSPYQKLEVVQALREGGHTVGMMGDGVNDALALRGADVGISVDTGTEIAKNAADIILLEKSLATVVVGVKLGRKTLLNTVKYIKMAASSNVRLPPSLLSHTN
jgi:Mg2+-importing ATPase